MENFDLNDEQMANILYEAYINNQPIPKDRIPAFLKKEQAYNVQHVLTEQKTKLADENLAGYKISLTSKETQDLFDSDTPLYGALTTSSLAGGSIELSAFSSPLLELELIFILKEDLSPTDDNEAIMRKTFVAPGIEVPDSRFEDWFPKLTLGQVIADSAVAGKIIVGKPKENLSYGQLENITGSLTFNGKEIASGPSSEVLGHPVNAVRWLAAELSKQNLSLKKGMYISSGTFILPKTLEKGFYEASYQGIGNVSLEVK